jgi:hypothetical protein
VEFAEKICANKKCKKKFAPKVHNAVYCSAECRKVVTNQKILKKYHDKKLIKLDKNRICQAESCTTKLSRYNEGFFCSSCEASRLNKKFQKTKAKKKNYGRHAGS